MTVPAGNLWEETAAEPFDAPPLEGDLRVDLAIVGAGYTGCAAALAAAEQGASVAVLEARHVGHGGSGRNVGLVNAGLWLPPDEVERSMGGAPGARLIEALGQGPETVFDLIERHQIRCEARRKGTLHCAHKPAAMRDLERRAAQWQARGAPVELLDAPAAQARVGSRAVHGALLDRRAGTIQPLGYLRGLARVAVSLGAQLYESTPVSGLRRDGGQWVLDTPQGTVRAARVLVATNAYHLPVPGMARAQTSLVHFFQAATEPLENAEFLKGEEGCWDTALVMSSFRRDAAGRLIIGAMGLPERDSGLHLRWLQKKLAALFPDLAGQRLTGLWHGRIAMTRDHVPKLVRPGPGLYAIFGYSGRGIAPGTVMGLALGRGILSGDMSKVPLQAVETYRETLTTLRSAYYEAGARALHLIPPARGG